MISSCEQDLHFADMVDWFCCGVLLCYVADWNSKCCFEVGGGSEKVLDEFLARSSHDDSRHFYQKSTNVCGIHLQLV